MKDEQRHGCFIQINPDGSLVLSRYYQDKIHGRKTEIYKSGKVHIKDYEHGKVISEKWIKPDDLKENDLTGGYQKL